MPKVLRGHRTLTFALNESKRAKPAIIVEYEEELEFGEEPREDKLDRITLVTSRSGPIELTLSDLMDLAVLIPEAAEELKPGGRQGKNPRSTDRASDESDPGESLSVRG